MKLLLCFILLSMLNVSGSIYSQNATFDLAAKDMTVKQVFKDIESQSNFRFLYNDDFAGLNRIVSLNTKGKCINEVLKELLADVNLTYKELENELIVITPLEISKQQQTVTLTGTVSDQAGNPIPGVSVFVEGTTIGTVTDPDGNFSLSVPEGSQTLVFSFIGMITREVPIVGTQFDIVLEPDYIGLEEVVAIGYGTQRRVNVIGSISSVSNQELTVNPVANVSTALAGRLPGAIVQQSSGLPGRDASVILVRGNTTLGHKSPLIVIDGIPERSLNSLEPGDIESITVLKDASAGIYGSRAANGVILITTRRGVESPPSFEYSGYYGIDTPTALPKMADAPTYAQMVREIEYYRGVAEGDMMYSLEDVEKFRSGEYPWTHPNTNWHDETLNRFTNSMHHNFGIRGGTSTIKYYGSFGTHSNTGIYKVNATEFDRYNLRANIDATLSPHLSISLDISGVREDRMYPTSSISEGSIWGAIMRQKPTEPAYWPNGLPGMDIEYGHQPVVMTSFETGFDDDKRYRSENMLTANFNVPWVEGLTISGNYAYDFYLRTRKDFHKPITLYSLDEAAYFAAGNTGKEDGSDFLMPVLRGRVPEPQLTDTYTDSRRITNSLRANYDKRIGSHYISSFIAVESMDYYTHTINAFRRYFISDELPYLFAGGTDALTNNASTGLDARLNYFGRLSYDYDEKYLFQFSLRRDGSLRFSKEAGRWGTFPSVLLGWRISSEEFWENNLSFINYFKLKASVGQMGNDAVAAFQYLTSYAFTTGGVFGTGLTYNTGIQQDGEPNPFITWEVANVYNAGFESYLFDSKIQLDLDVFYQRRSEILVKRDVSVPQFTGITLPDENFGIVDSRGFELVLGYSDRVLAGDFSYSINGNLAFARNKIVEMDEPERAVPWQNMTGHPMGSILLYNKIGIFRDWDHVNSLPHVAGARPGDIIIEDYDGDGEITTDDRTIYNKSATPEITYGVSFSLRFRNFELSGLLQGIGNTYQRLGRTGLIGMDGNFMDFDAQGRWTEDNPDATKPRTFMRSEEYWRSSHITDHDYYNRAFCRLKNLELSYSIPRRLQNTFGLTNAHVYVSGQNLFLLYNANEIGTDPEIMNLSLNPVMKTYAMGVRIRF